MAGRVVVRLNHKDANVILNNFIGKVVLMFHKTKSRIASQKAKFPRLQNVYFTWYNGVKSKPPFWPFMK